MPYSAKILVTLALVGFVAACGRQEPEPAPIPITPTYDKLGTATCPVGTTLATDGATGAQICVEPSAVEPAAI